MAVAMTFADNTMSYQYIQELIKMDVNYLKTTPHHTIHLY